MSLEMKALRCAYAQSDRDKFEIASPAAEPGERQK